jgi:hypothetical protein
MLFRYNNTIKIKGGFMFKRYRRLGVAEARPVTYEEIRLGAVAMQNDGISISAADLSNGSPKPGDMIARNPSNYKDQWLISRRYWGENFEQEPEEVQCHL